MNSAIKVRDEVTLLNTIAVSAHADTKEGNKAYRKRISKLSRELENINKPENFWDNLRKNRRKETIFEALKKSKRK